MNKIKLDPSTFHGGKINDTTLVLEGMKILKDLLISIDDKLNRIYLDMAKGENFGKEGD